MCSQLNHNLRIQKTWGTEDKVYQIDSDRPEIGQPYNYTKPTQILSKNIKLRSSTTKQFNTHLYIFNYIIIAVI